MFNNRRPANIVPGETPVYINNSNSLWGSNWVKAVVVKVTATGQVTVQTDKGQRRFKANDYEVGGADYRSPKLCWNVAEIEQQIKDKEAEDACAIALKKVAKFIEEHRFYLHDEDKVKLLELVNAVPVVPKAAA